MCGAEAGEVPGGRGAHPQAWGAEVPVERKAGWGAEGWHCLEAWLSGLGPARALSYVAHASWHLSRHPEMAAEDLLGVWSPCWPWGLDPHEKPVPPRSGQRKNINFRADSKVGGTHLLCLCSSDGSHRCPWLMEEATEAWQSHALGQRWHHAWRGGRCETL